MKKLVLATVLLSTVMMRAEKHAPVVASGKVGVTARVFHPEARNWRGDAVKELRTTVWYPADGASVETRQTIGPPGTPLFEAGMAMPHAEMEPTLRKLPMIVLSHGTGGSAEQMAWLGTALARAGFIAVAVNHPGNNSQEPLTAEGFVLWWERATDLSNVIDGMLKDEDFGPRIDRERIGAAGFSIGGFTVMEIAGARADISVVMDDCRKNPKKTTCSVPEMKNLGTPVEMLQAARKTSGESLARSEESYRDPRVKAVFAIAPAISHAQTIESLKSIRIPVDIVVGAADPIAPPSENADYLRAYTHAGELVMPGVSHYTFLDTCTAAGKVKSGMYCEDPPGTDRDKVHAEASGEAVAFFTKALRGR